jgi:hypothetical protein
VDLEWLREVYEIGLLGPGETTSGEPTMAAVMLDRVAQVVRLHRQAGVNLEGIVLLLE